MPLTRRRQVFAIASAAGLVLIIATVLVWNVARIEKVMIITGAVIAQNKDPHLQRPIANAVVTAESVEAGGKAVSANSGLFRIALDRPVAAGDMIKIRVEHPAYNPFELVEPAGNRIQVLRLTAAKREAGAPVPHQRSRIANIRVRYATRTTSTTTVGTAVRTFDVVNTGNVPCQSRPPCSPDGRWKAAIGSLTLDTEENRKEFRNVRVSCIAGPCPFSAIELDRFSRGGQAIAVSVRNWSDPVTYLLEGEVVQTMETERVRRTYPVTFGRSMNFTLPAAATGPSIEAEMDGSEIVFPLGPELRLSWGTCRFESGPDGTKQYRCELKPGYSFDPP